MNRTKSVQEYATMWKRCLAELPQVKTERMVPCAPFHDIVVKSSMLVGGIL